MDKHGHSSTGDVYFSTGDVGVYIDMQLIHKPGDVSVSPLPTNSNINFINCIIIINMNTCDDRSYLVTHKMLLYFDKI